MGLESSTPVGPWLGLPKQDNWQWLPFGHQTGELGLGEIKKVSALTLDGCKQTQTVATEVKSNDPSQ